MFPLRPLLPSKASCSKAVVNWGLPEDVFICMNICLCSTECNVCVVIKFIWILYDTLEVYSCRLYSLESCRFNCMRHCSHFKFLLDQHLLFSQLWLMFAAFSIICSFALFRMFPVFMLNAKYQYQCTVFSNNWLMYGPLLRSKTKNVVNKFPIFLMHEWVFLLYLLILTLLVF